MSHGPKPSVGDDIEGICSRFEKGWRAGQRPKPEEHLAETPLDQREALLLELLGLEYSYRRKNSESGIEDEFRRRFPNDGSLIERLLSQFAERREHLPGNMDSSQKAATTGPNVPTGAEFDMPAQLGRYRIKEKIGSGSYGTVYRAFDEELQREVAIKFPHQQQIESAEEADAYIAEARVLASLDHVGIVPVFDVGRSDDGRCYLVSKFVEGSDLRKRLEDGRPPLAEAVRIILTVADALHYAHQRGLVHRDIKPANILLDSAGQPFIADFGLAIKEEEIGHGPGFVGTPVYMSPEQARNEGHRVDARSDVYSLGVVFYELLTGRRPFSGGLAGVLNQIKTQEPKPPRQVDNSIPRELDRICLKALAKRAVDRYSTALDLADDLRAAQLKGKAKPSKPVELRFVMPTTADKTAAAPHAPVISESGPIVLPTKVIPKGLRSFDSSDADFFLELVPGPRDRDGLPETTRFWKLRIEELDADETFRVGLLYGPSGCGKSSLVKAGLLPRLADHVVAVYVEATSDGTEARLLYGLRKHCPMLPEDLGLVDTLAHLRRGHGTPAGVKVLIVIDQFEQWLHAMRNEQDTELVQALRQCDGSRVQCLLMVRDDFWMAATRFMHDLEIRLLEGQNSAHVDLFDIRHARKVLAAFGSAFVTLPETLKPEHEQFLDQAAAGLAQDGKVIPVRLSLFAEMVKGKPWTPATLKHVGGMEGIGVTFFEETFSATSAPPEHRYHQKAARAVLRALLPEQASDIKGHMRSQQELLQASGYANRPREFEALLNILDGELRLMTPTDPEGKDEGEVRNTGSDSSLKYYQLTHDYLVPELQKWLERKQRETVRGRAELLLGERAALWAVKPANRYLPSWLEWAKIRLFTRSKNWTEPHRRMMKKSAWLYSLWTTVALLLLGLIGWAAYSKYCSMRADFLVLQLKYVETPYVWETIEELGPYRRWADPLLQSIVIAENSNTKQRLHARLALGTTDADVLLALLLDAGFSDHPQLRAAIDEHKPELVKLLKKELASSSIPAGASAAERETLMKRQGRAYAGLMRLGETDAVWTELSHSSNPNLRTQLVHDLGLVGTPIPVIARRLEIESETSARRSLMLSFGEFTGDRLPDALRHSLTLKFLEWYRKDPDPGIHSAIDWLLRHGQLGKAPRKFDWQQASALQEIDRELINRPSETRNWYVNKSLHTLAVVRGPVIFKMGSPLSEPGRTTDRELQHAKRIGRSFAIATKETTVEQYRRFLKDHDGIEAAFERNPKFKADEDGPVTALTWFEAAQYCDWLSQQAGLPESEWCYAGVKEIDGIKRLPENFLERTGYRLPTEAEWEYACRAGTTTSRYFGDSEEMLKEYAWYSKSTNDERAFPVGQLKPNDLGLFDMHGNVFEWCHDLYVANLSADGEPSGDDVDPDIYATRPSRVLRSAAFNSHASFVRSAYRFAQPQGNRLLNGGFRVARTMPTR